MMDSPEGNISKLPVWAQTYIKQLETKIQRLEYEGESKETGVIGGYPVIGEYVYLPEDGTVRFSFPSHYGNPRYIEVSKDEDSSNSLDGIRIRTSCTSMFVRPNVANLIEVLIPET